MGHGPAAEISQVSCNVCWHLNNFRRGMDEPGSVKIRTELNRSSGWTTCYIKVGKYSVKGEKKVVSSLFPPWHGNSLSPLSSSEKVHCCLTVPEHKVLYLQDRHNMYSSNAMFSHIAPPPTCLDTILERDEVAIVSMSVHPLIFPSAPATLPISVGSSPLGIGLTSSSLLRQHQKVIRL